MELQPLLHLGLCTDKRRFHFCYGSVTSALCMPCCSVCCRSRTAPTGLPQPPRRFVVYELQPSGSSSSGGSALPHAQLLAQTDVPDSSTAVHGMGWVGGQLAVCAGMRYLLVSPFGPAAGGSSPAPSGGSGVQWRELFSVPEELAYSPAMLATMPDLGRALLVVVSRRWWLAWASCWHWLLLPAAARPCSRCRARFHRLDRRPSAAGQCIQVVPLFAPELPFASPLCPAPPDSHHHRAPPALSLTQPATQWGARCRWKAWVLRPVPWLPLDPFCWLSAREASMSLTGRAAARCSG